MSKSLVIVESPAKAKTIEKYLGKGFDVRASVGHIMDLPKNDIGVELKNRTFVPELIVSPGKEKVVDQLKKLAEKADEIFLAPDPDREGEAIAYHLALQLGTTAKERKKISRVTFNEITKKAVQEAFNHARDVDQNLVDAQQTRRVLDRLVGYQISPLLWDKVRRGLSAGRVQTVAVRLIVEREREIGAFQPVEYWTLDAHAAPGAAGGQELQGAFCRHRWRAGPAWRTGKDKEGKDAVHRQRAAGPEIDGRGGRSAGQGQVVAGVGAVSRAAAPAAPPFITSQLQRDASSKLGFNVRRTMGVAQRLYEGVDMGTEGTAGLITYMRTDSPRVAPEASPGRGSGSARNWGQSICPRTPTSTRARRMRRMRTKPSARPMRRARPSRLRVI